MHLHWRIVSLTESFLTWKRQKRSKTISTISTFTDADWGGRKDTNENLKSLEKDMRTTSRTINLLGDSPICWSRKRQPCVSLSTMESELIAHSSGCQDALCARNLMRELLPTEKIKSFPCAITFQRFYNRKISQTNQLHVTSTWDSTSLEISSKGNGNFWKSTMFAEKRILLTFSLKLSERTFAPNQQSGVTFRGRVIINPVHNPCQ